MFLIIIWKHKNIKAVKNTTTKKKPFSFYEQAITTALTGYFISYTPLVLVYWIKTWLMLFEVSELTVMFKEPF